MGERPQLLRDVPLAPDEVLAFDVQHGHHVGVGQVDDVVEHDVVPVEDTRQQRIDADALALTGTTELGRPHTLGWCTGTAPGSFPVDAVLVVFLGNVALGVVEPVEAERWEVAADL